MNDSAELHTKKYFSVHELRELYSLMHQELKEIWCYLWINQLSKDPVDMIMAVEIVTHRGSCVVSVHDTDNAMEVNAFSYPEIREKILQEAGDKIHLYRIPASDTQMWKNCIGKKIQAIELTREGENYLCDSMVLNMGDEMRIIRAGVLDGLVIDFYEKDV